MSKLRPRCDCPRSSYLPVHRTYPGKQDQYSLEISYDVDECKNHPKSHINRRNEIHRIFMIPLAELPPNLTEDEQAIFKAAFKNCQVQKISKSNWINAISAHLSLESVQRVFFDKFLHSGVVEQIEEYYSTKSGKRESVLLTDRGYNFLKEHLDVIERNEQIMLSQQLIEETLKIIIQNPSPQLNHLIDLIRDQREKLTSKNPFWQKDSGESIKPECVQTKTPVYYIIVKALCVWIRMFRERMTKRELSCVCFVEDPLIKVKDPSKVLDTLYDSLEAIIQPQLLGFRDLDDFGLTKTLETMQMSGSISIIKNNQTFPIQGSVILLNSYEFQNIKSITSDCHNVLCVENLAVFTQMVYDKFALEEDLLILFIAGKSSRYLQKILEIIANDNKKHTWWAWLDYDLGGVEIFQFLEEELAPNLVNPIIPFLSKPVTYREISTKNREKIKKIIDGGSSSIRQFGNHILSNGKIEQEYFIKDYKAILKACFK